MIWWWSIPKFDYLLRHHDIQKPFENFEENGIIAALDIVYYVTNQKETVSDWKKVISFSRFCIGENQVIREENICRYTLLNLYLFFTFNIHKHMYACPK